MDGNGRWAKQRGLPRTAGHEQGESSLFDVVEGAIEIGVEWLSAYAFSTENWKRSPDEVRFLMGFNRDVIRRRRDDMHAMGVRVRWAGRRPRLWKSVIEELEIAEEMTRDNTVMTLTMCVNYGGRAEIADAAAALARDAVAGRVDPAKVTDRVLARYLDEPDMPDVDLFVRSSGEQRTCNFLLWQSAYAEMVFRTRCGRTTTGASCGRRSRSTPDATAATAAPRICEEAIVRLHHVNIVVRPGETDQLLGFYTDVLGLRRADKPSEGTTPGGAWFDISDANQLHISERADAVMHDDMHFGLVVDDFDAVVGRLAAAGAPWTAAG